MGKKIYKRKWFWAIIIALCFIVAYEGTVRYLTNKGERLLEKSYGAEVSNREEGLAVAKKSLRYVKYAHRLQPWNQEIILLKETIYGSMSLSILRWKMEEYYDDALYYSILGLWTGNKLSPEYKSHHHSMNPHYFRMARLYYLIGEFDAEIEVYQYAIQNDPDLPLAYYRLGQIYLMEEQFKDSRWYMMKAATLSFRKHHTCPR